MTDAFLQIQNLEISFDGDRIIAGLNFAIHKNTLTTFLGPSGSGKTTVLRAIAGLNQKLNGRILLDGKEIQKLPVNKRKIGMIFQSYALFPNLTVFENVAYGLKARKKSNSEIHDSVEKMISLVGLDDKINAYPNNLSGGQKQRVAIARAMVLKPKLLLLDEPLSALDAKTRVELRNQIRHYQQQLGITMLFVTHDQTEAMAISDNVIVMDHGILQQQGSPAAIYAHPANNFMANFIGSHNVLDGKDLLRLGFNTIKNQNINPKALYVIRPELFSFDQKIENALEISGKIKSISVLGDRISCEFQTEKGLLLRFERLNKNSSFSIGKLAKLYLRDSDIVKVGS
ncbi:ABC transporter ATP-binding protein [Lentilactobacillus raoultii]|uniref:ABC transporter ATP-binding protein n=1 Tax=Lentilactobacillus raoultii TaxID=1987503 RepID=A0ABW3PUX9_9LACO|nr:ABC transporter ATP-binding protein [Lentilactobacillus raoultii]